MEILFIIIASIAILIKISNLSARVDKLEKFAQNTVRPVVAKPAVAEEHTTLPQVVETHAAPVQQTEQQSPALAKLIDYVKTESAKGVSRDAIREALLIKGWQQDVVATALESFSVPTPEVEEQEQYQNESDPVVDWFKKDLLLKIGALFLIIGFGWLVSYAFLNNWIGPVGRISLGILGGLVFMLIGWKRMQTFADQGGVFIVLGATITMLTVFAGRQYYDFFSPLSALVFHFLCAAYVAGASLKYQRRTLAIAGVVMAFLAPLFTHGDGNYIGLFAYLFVVTIASVFMDAYIGKREVGLTALVLVLVYTLPYLSGGMDADKGVILLFVYAFTVIFFIANIIAVLRAKDDEVQTLVLGAGLGAFYLLIGIFIAAPKEWQGLILSAWMIVFAVGAFLVSRKVQRREPFYAYGIAAILLLVAATAIQFSGAVLTLAFLAEATVLTLGLFKLSPEKDSAVTASFAYVLPFMLSLPSFFAASWNTGVLHKDFFVLFLVGGVFVAVGSIFARYFESRGDMNSASAGNAFLVTGSVYAYGIIWLALGSIVGGGAAVTIALFLYTFIGIWFYFQGIALGRKGYRTYGGVLIGLVIMRLLIIDVWVMALAPRIITFFMIGTLLVSTAFIGKNKNQTKTDNHANEI